jgi:hypothetical protein
MTRPMKFLVKILVKNKSLKKNWYFWLPLGLILVGGITGSWLPQIEAKEMETAQMKQPSNTNCSEATLTGTVIKKPWAKTAESWMAGGSEYYVLDVGDGEVEERSAREGVILRPSDNVPFDSFEQYVDRKVKVTGEYVEAKPYTPQSPLESYPTDMNGNPLPTGAGFKVCEIEI